MSLQSFLTNTRDFVLNTANSVADVKAKFHAVEQAKDNVQPLPDGTYYVSPSAYGASTPATYEPDMSGALSQYAIPLALGGVALALFLTSKG